MVENLNFKNGDFVVVNYSGESYRGKVIDSNEKGKVRVKVLLSTRKKDDNQTELLIEKENVEKILDL